MDKYIFASMFSDMQDIFYLPEDHPKWQKINENRIEIKIDEDEKIVAYEELYTEQLSASMAGIKKT